ncbi:hypothetical protein N9L68_00035 [bacterium]|nr:hypothetical protein [bacterium]
MLVSRSVFYYCLFWGCYYYSYDHKYLILIIITIISIIINNENKNNNNNTNVVIHVIIVFVDSLLLSLHPVLSAFSVYGGLEGAPRSGHGDEAVAALGIKYDEAANDDDDADADSYNKFRYQTVMDDVDQDYGDDSDTND